MAVPYTLGTWVVKEGRADDFIAAWTEFATWSRDNAPGAIRAELLRDVDNPSRFVTVGPWENLAAIERWRALDGFKQRVVSIRELLEKFEPSTLELVTEVR